MKRQNATKRQPIHREDPVSSWLVRETEGPKRYDPDFTAGKGKPFIDKCTVTVELVWGKRVHHEGLDSIEGKAYHILHGPTARKSMDDFAADLNAKKTPPSELKKCLLDGSRPPKDGGPNQMSFFDLKGVR